MDAQKVVEKGTLQPYVFVYACWDTYVVYVYAVVCEAHGTCVTQKKRREKRHGARLYKSVKCRIRCAEAVTTGAGVGKSWDERREVFRVGYRSWYPPEWRSGKRQRYDKGEGTASREKARISLSGSSSQSMPAGHFSCLFRFL